MRWEDLQIDAVNGKGERLSNQQVDCATFGYDLQSREWRYFRLFEI
jgi:hypothetical protein